MKKWLKETKELLEKQGIDVEASYKEYCRTRKDDVIDKLLEKLSDVEEESKWHCRWKYQPFVKPKQKNFGPN